MKTAAINSAIDAAYWFYDKADNENAMLETKKVQALLFFAQAKYALENNMKYFMPCVFICNKDGFCETNVEKVLAQGKPLLATASVGEKESAFLEKIWKEYGKYSAIELSEMVKKTASYKNCFHNSAKNVVQLNSMVENFIDDSNIGEDVKTSSVDGKVLLSQNGPVVVSSWKPRKLGV